MNFEERKNIETEELVRNEESLAFGEIAPLDRLQNQIRLAKDLFEKINGEIDHEKFHNDLDFRNSIMNFWSEGDGKSYSAAYRRLEDSDWFKKHPDLKGDIFKIKIEHLFDFIEFEKEN
jgi:hypothetical protein